MILLLPTLAVVSNLAMANAQSCAPDPTDVRIETKIDEPRLDTSKDGEQLLTVGGIAIDSEIRIANDATDGNSVCAWPSVVTVTLSTSPTVYVLTDRGECQRSVGLKHEMEHVAIDQRIIQRYVPIFRRRIAAMAEAIAADGSPPGRDLRTQRHRIEEKVNAVIAVVSDQLNADRSTEQHAFDSIEEYTRVSSTCPQVTLAPR